MTVRCCTPQGTVGLTSGGWQDGHNKCVIGDDRKRAFALHVVALRLYLVHAWVRWESGRTMALGVARVTDFQIRSPIFASVGGMHSHGVQTGVLSDDGLLSGMAQSLQSLSYYHRAHPLAVWAIAIGAGLNWVFMRTRTHFIMRSISPRPSSWKSISGVQGTGCDTTALEMSNRIPSGQS